MVGYGSNLDDSELCVKAFAEIQRAVRGQKRQHNPQPGGRRRVEIRPSVVRAVAIAVREETQQYNEWQLGLSTNETVVGNYVVDEAAAWKQRCPVTHQILATAVRAPALPAIADCERPRQITLHGTGSQQSSLPHAKTDHAAQRQTTHGEKTPPAHRIIR